MSRRSEATAAVLAALALAMPAGCGDETVEGTPPDAPAGMRLTSSAFAPGATIPARFTCNGADVSPPLAWTGVTARAQALALLMEDPDAPGGTFVHWTLFNISQDVSSIRAGQVPAGALQGENSFGNSRYDGPCPPEGDEAHHYEFVIYSLRSELGLGARASPDEVRAAIADQALELGELRGTFGR